VPAVRLRVLLPVIAALALLLQPVATWAAAGVERDAACCCPEPAKCDCHDHGKGHAEPQMRRCGGEVSVVAPLLLIADVPAAAPAIAAVRPVRAPAAAPAWSVEDRAIPPEKPPF
jgi:hypothetical protein